ncbi:hypothetical protein [Streptomyces sp. NPDC006368]|uniref:hypothetical protein n=1 Tax=Streptomyces sp. NPDC006368 TaxID=3156760 RepID=UPI0033A83DF3
MAHSEVGLHRENVRLDAEELCGARFVATASVRCPESFEVYRVGRSWGDSLRCSPEDRERWDTAARDCLDALSRALEDLYRAHGGRKGEVNLYKGTRGWSHITEPRHWPGWRRRLVERSEQAQLAFAAAVRRVEEEYRPVREEIAERLAVYKAEQAAAELARRREAERRRSVLDTVAAGQVWRFGTDPAGSPVLVHRVDVPASLELPDPRAGSSSEGSLTARQLEEALLALVRGSGYTTEIRWDEAARAEVERECRASEVSIAFGQWWREVTKGVWRNTSYGPQPVPPPPPVTRSLGAGIGGSGVSGTGGYSGGFSGFGGY